MSPTVAERCNILLPLNSEDTFSFFLNIFWLWRLWLKMPQLLRLCFDHNKSDFSCGQHSNEAGGPTSSWCSIFTWFLFWLVLCPWGPTKDSSEKMLKSGDFFGLKRFFFGVKVSTEEVKAGVLLSDAVFRFSIQVFLKDSFQELHSPITCFTNHL